MKNKSASKHRSGRIDETIKIPCDYAWKVLDKVTDDLRPYLPESDYELVKLICRNRDIAAYHILSEDWGLQSMNLSCDEGFVKSCRYILASLLKKYRFTSDKIPREEAALVKYLRAEQSCKDFNEFEYLKLVAPGDDETPVLFSYARDFLKKLLGETIPGHHALTEWCRHGPGATLDTSKGQVSNYDKFENWPYSCTLDAYRYARFAIETDQRWFGALQDSYRERNNIAQWLPLDMKKFWTDVLSIETQDKLAFVPKNSEIERIISIGPTMNVYLQLGVDGFIRRRLKRYDIDLDDQTKNQRLARLGSIRDTEKSYVTIDLSAASDSISTKLCELLLPPDWYKFLMDLRSPMGRFESRQLNVTYNKIAAMGNGYTFALESAIFASALFAVQKFVDKKINPLDIAVYGDDLICRKYLVDKVIKILALFGFKLNLQKSFLSGPVRESCGTDWFLGHNVRPVFLEDDPKNVRELFNDINRLDRLLQLRVQKEGSKCVTFMERWIPEPLRGYVGPCSDEDFDSYRHCSFPVERYNHGVYKFRRLVVQPRKRKVRSFLFRKLMHDLRPTPSRPLLFTLFELERASVCKWETKLDKSGSRFTVTQRGAETVGEKYSTVSIWRSEYEEPRP